MRKTIEYIRIQITFRFFFSDSVLNVCRELLAKKYHLFDLPLLDYHSKCRNAFSHTFCTQN